MIRFMAVLTTLTLNINGLSEVHKIKELWKEILRTNVICLQETHLSVGQEYAFFLYAQSFDFFFSYGTRASTGLVTAIHRSVIVNAVKMFEIRGHMLVVDVETTNGLTQVINVYVPNNTSEQKAFFQAVDTCCTDQILLLGDFNSVLCAHNHVSQHHDGTTSQLLNLISKWSLIEPEGLHLNSFTYHHPSISGCKSCIDRIHSNML